MNAIKMLLRLALIFVVTGFVVGTVVGGTSGCRSEAPAALTGSRFVEPLADSGPMSVRINEVWRRDVGENIDVRGRQMAVWDDGTIWIGGNETIWEMSPEGETIRAVPEPASASGRGAALAMAATPDRSSVALVSRNGMTFFPHRDGATGVFTAMYRNSVSGIATLPNDQVLLSYGQYPDDPQVAFALHRYSHDGSHVESWHPAFSSDDWTVVTHLTGGPITTTSEGDLLLAEQTPPFRIVRYAGGASDSTPEVLEDQSIIPADEIRRAVLPNGDKGIQWNRPVFIAETPDGNILTVIRYYPRRQRSQGLWVIMSPSGDVLAKTRFAEDYRRISPTGVAGRYFAVHDGNIVALEVAVEPQQPPP